MDLFIIDESQPKGDLCNPYDVTEIDIAEIPAQWVSLICSECARRHLTTLQSLVANLESQKLYEEPIATRYIGKCERCNGYEGPRKTGRDWNIWEPYR